MTRTCEDFEVDCERRAHGALGPDEASALDEHLAGCGRCRGFAALVGEVDAGMQRAAGEAALEVRWASVEQRLDERARQARRSRLVVAPALLGSAALAWAMGLPAGPALGMAAAALVTAAIARRMSLRWLGELAQAQATREGLLAFSRRQVQDELRAARWGSVALGLLALAQVAVVEALGPGPRPARLAVMAGAALLAGTALVMAFYQAPRLRRELKELA